MMGAMQPWGQQGLRHNFLCAGVAAPQLLVAAGRFRYLLVVSCVSSHTDSQHCMPPHVLITCPLLPPCCCCCCSCSAGPLGRHPPATPAAPLQTGVPPTRGDQACRFPLSPCSPMKWRAPTLLLTRHPVRVTPLTLVTPLRRRYCRRRHPRHPVHPCCLWGVVVVGSGAQVTPGERYQQWQQRPVGHPPLCRQVPRRQWYPPEGPAAVVWVSLGSMVTWRWQGGMQMPGVAP